MGKKQILIFQYDCMIDTETLKAYGDYIQKMLDTYGYAVTDSRVTLKIFEVDGTIWEKENGSL